MMSKELMKKTILPMLLLAVWAWVAYHFCVSLEQTELWKIWMVVGMPFGIHRMCIWLLPKNFDIGSSRMVHTSCCVCFGKVFCEFVKISRGLNEIFIGTPSHWLAYHKLIQCTL